MSARKNTSVIETELKIKLSRKDLERVYRSLTGNQNVSCVSHKFMPRVYYDTKKLELYKKKMSLRVQYKRGKDGKLGGYEQTVKIEVPLKTKTLGKGIFCRKECKNITKTHKPDLDVVRDKQVSKAIAPFKRKKLKPIFTAAIERRFFEWDLKKGKKEGTVEVAFDVGQIILTDSNKHRDFFEIEVEIKKGPPELIEVVKKEIFRIAPKARVQALSKGDQGSQFYLKHKHKKSHQP